GYAELQALEQKPMTMNDWKNFLDQQLRMLNKDILTDNGKISHRQAIEKAEKEFDIYRQREMRQLESDFDRAVKQLTQKSENDGNR
ncbi:MAG: virulence RhuM family protein, partial [Tannerella sp.]|nr:virulence RhuM family protein [Tannerella sp.]